MRLSLERARVTTPITWLTILGVLLLPVLVGGILVGALAEPTKNLDRLAVAIVNNDEPVEIDGQLVPLGRQLTAGFVEGSDEIDSNISWVLSHEEDAKKGLDSGRYVAVVTIPEGFSTAATSTMPGESPRKATISVETPPDGKVADELIANAFASQASVLMGDTLSATYLENVLLSFTTLNDKLGEAADGADQLSEGATTASDGARSLSDGAGKLESGSRQLSGGASELSSGAQKLSGGATLLSDGAGKLAAGMDKSAQGTKAWAGGARALATETGGLATGLDEMADQVAQMPGVPSQILDAAKALDAHAPEAIKGLTASADQLRKAAESCADNGGSAELCQMLSQASASADKAVPELSKALGRTDELVAGLEQLDGAAPQLSAGLRASADGARKLQGGMSSLADGADQLADGNASLAVGARGISGGAKDLSSGASALSGGAAQLSTGASGIADGASGLSDGSASLADGIEELAKGTTSLSEGLNEAVSQLPRYTDSEATTLADIISAPVSAETTSNAADTLVPALAAIVLWFGGLGTFVALRAVTSRALVSRRSSLGLTLTSGWPGVVIGAAQGILVALVVQVTAGYEASTWWAFAGVAALAGMSFALVHQALVAVFRGAGRWIAVGIGVVAIATSIVSTVPPVFFDIAGVLPVDPATTLLTTVATSSGSAGAALTALVVWALIAIAATTLSVARRRSLSPKAALAVS